MRAVAAKSFVEAFQALPLLQSLDIFYPDFSYWYMNTVIPGWCWETTCCCWRKRARALWV